MSLLKKNISDISNSLFVRPVLLLLVCFFCACVTGPGRNSNDDTDDDRVFSVLFTGDILLSHEAKDFILRHGNEYVVKKIKDELLKYDYVIANLETPITTRGIPHDNKPYVFQISSKIAKTITLMKIDAVTLANNHIMDYGETGMDDTIQFLKKHSIAYAGAGKNIHEARKPLKLKLGQKDLFVLAYNERPPVNFSATISSAGAAPFDIEIIKSDIVKYKRKDSIVIVAPHWGIEKTKVPKRYQVRAAHAFIEAGADAVIGHHPHWPQVIEIYKNKPVIYSLGNFINGFYGKKEMDNIIAALYFRGSELKMLKVVPIAGQNKKIHFQPYVCNGDQARSLLTLLHTLSKRIGTTFDIVGDKGYYYFSDRIADNQDKPGNSVKIKAN